MSQVGRNNRRHLASPEAPHRVAGPVETSASENTAADIPAAFANPAPGRSPMQRKSSILSTAVIAIIVPGLFATVALPAYAYTAAPVSTAADATKVLQDIKQSNAQTVVVDSSAKPTAVSRDAFSATSSAEVQRAALAVSYAAYTGPTVADFLKNPPYPSFSLDQVVAVALQYQGVPYVYGGATPSGFDCSGYIMFVYAQFGIALPHSSSGIGAAGTPISTADAVPGDIVILPGHAGIYMGNGQFIDSGDYGSVIHVRAIYDGNYYIVRLGI